MILASPDVDPCSLGHWIETKIAIDDDVHRNRHFLDNKFTKNLKEKIRLTESIRFKQLR
jgi:hypothetical protein